MSHDLNFRNGKASMYSLKEIPWHGLGQRTDHCLTAKEVIQQAQLDYNVKKGRAYVKYLSEDEIASGTKGILVPNTYFTYRDDTGDPLCSDGKALTGQYNIIQNREAFEFLDSLSQAGDIRYETAGALRSGELVFVTAKLPKSLLANSPEKIDQYLLIFLSHDGTSSVVVKFTPIRVVCNNTLSAALGRGNEIRIRHSKSYKEKLEEAKKVLGLVEYSNSLLGEAYEKFRLINLEDEEVKDLIEHTFLDKGELAWVNEKGYDLLSPSDIRASKEVISTRKINQMNDVYKYYNYGPGQNTVDASSTLWGYFNAVTGYYQNVKSFTNQEKKLMSIDNGGAFNRANKVINLCHKFANDPTCLIN